MSWAARIRLDDRPQEIVGVLPLFFRFPNCEVELFVPCAMDAEERSARSSHYLDVIARRRSGVSLEEAREEMDAIAAGLPEQYPESNEDNGVVIRRLANQLVGNARTLLLMLFTAVLAVLLIAVGNLANLFLARSAARRREVAVRAALGASRARILAQLMTEAFLWRGARARARPLRARLRPHSRAEPRCSGGYAIRAGYARFHFAALDGVALGMGLLPALSLLREERRRDGVSTRASRDGRPYAAKLQQPHELGARLRARECTDDACRVIGSQI